MQQLHRGSSSVHITLQEEPVWLHHLLCFVGSLTCYEFTQDNIYSFPGFEFPCLERDVIDIGSSLTSAHKVELFAMSRMVQKPDCNCKHVRNNASCFMDRRLESTEHIPTWRVEEAPMHKCATSFGRFIWHLHKCFHMYMI